LRHDPIVFAQYLFDTEAEIGETGKPACNVLFDLLGATGHCVSRYARPQLMCDTILGENRVRDVQPALIPQLLYEPVD
jgi:hypothetical protein